MIRIDENHWLKCGLEMFNGVYQAAAVITNDYSDWNVRPLEEFKGWFKIKVKWELNGFEISYRQEKEVDWTLLRIGYLKSDENSKIEVGIMAASPDKEGGFEVQFKDFKLI